MIPTFTPVSGGNFNIQDIKIEGATEWNDSLQILDEGGATIATYMYFTAETSGLAADGWQDESGELANVSLLPGQSVLVDTADSAKITFAGAVKTESTEIVTIAGFNFIGNNTPVAIDIQDIKIEGATEWNNSLQILDAGGATVATYMYFTAETSGLAADGWQDESGELATVSLLPGMGFLVDTAESATITIPGVSK